MNATSSTLARPATTAVQNEVSLRLVQSRAEEPELIDQEFERVALGVGIPPRPEILNKLNTEARKDAPNFQHIEKLICADVGLSAALIKTINSPFYGLRNKAVSVTQAINMLGLSTLSRIVTGMVLRNTLSGAKQVNMERFWDASAKVALVSSYIAKQLPGINRDEAYTFGLFQDCGIPLLMNRFPNYKETLGLANKTPNKKFTEVEDEAHGMSHATMGYLLAKSWGLPDTITQAIRFHHEHEMLAEKQNTLSVDSQNLIALALLAERAIQVNTCLDQTVEWAKGGTLVMEHFGFAEADFNEIVEDVMEILNDGES